MDLRNDVLPIDDDGSAGGSAQRGVKDRAVLGNVDFAAGEHRIDPARFEFQMLYGVRRDLQRKLVAQGYKVRVYVPFGREWYPYFMRRLAERPANVLFLARNILRA